MNPLQIVGRTPKSNCGQCGHPTCLAFAAQVCLAGEDPSKCPFLDTKGLDLPTVSTANLEDAGRQRDLALVQHLKEKVAGLDLPTIAPALGALVDQHNPKILTFSYLGQEVRLDQDGILLDGKSPEDPRDMILLYNYVHVGGGSGLSGEWVGLESLPNSISKVKTLSVYGEKPLAELLQGADAVHIAQHFSVLGGTAVPESTADASFIIPVLPMIPLQIHFWEADLEDDFPAEAKILFDRNVLDYLDIESLVFTAERLADRLSLLFRVV